jgi:hypothetical protein
MANSVTPVQAPASALPRVRDLTYAGLVTGVWSGLLSLVVYGIGRLLGVPFEVAAPGGGLQVVPWFAVLLVPVGVAVLGGLLAALARGHARCRSIVLWVGTLLAIASLAGPLAQPADVLWSTRIWLVVPHVITWLLVVPQIARIVGDSDPRYVVFPTR